MPKSHTVRSYDRELDLLKSTISEMGKVAEEQLAKAIEALITKDSKMAVNVIYTDSQVNDLQNAVDRLTVRMLAVRQPMGSDLRHIISALKMAAELERIADYAANIAKNGMNLDHVYLEKPVWLIIRMAELAIQMLKDVIAAYLELNVPRAIEVWHQDAEINQIYADLLTQLRSYMQADSDNINTYTSLIFTARCCERIGDHIKNVAEGVYFIIHGDLSTDHPRDKKQHVG
ncbi:MAG: phosphate signaling complex protein PhoU [Deltaproteobacteria bacterium]|jgi:phosphate transport system protein|nr:phosphate signaling complex protein PhoU [Deltaproteobacteria bacterium]